MAGQIGWEKVVNEEFQSEKKKRDSRKAEFCRGQPFVCDARRRAPLATYPGTTRAAPWVPLFGLAPCVVYRAAAGCHPRGALLPHHFTLSCPRGHRRHHFCGTFRGLAPPRRYLAPCPVEPGLSSISARDTATVWPTPRPV